MARITRRELKSDKFAQEVGLTVDFFEEHQKDVVRFGAIAVAAVLLIVGYVIYQRHQHSAREEALAQAIQVQETPVVAVAPPNGQRVFPTQEAKDEAATKAFTDLENKYSGTTEGDIADYYLGAILADQGKLADAEKRFTQVAAKADKNIASLARNALAEIYFSDGRADQGEKILRDLIANPTVFVSKEQATLSLARHLTGKNNAEARKLLSPLKDGKGPVAQSATILYSQLAPQ